jgi:hypothetical protein
MDEDNSGIIDQRKFLSYLDRREELSPGPAREESAIEAIKDFSDLSVNKDDGGSALTLSKSTNQEESAESDSESDKDVGRGQDDQSESEEEDTNSERTVSDNGTESKNDKSGSRPVETEAHPQANLFAMIDRNSDGKLTLIEFIQALRTQPAVSKV